MVMLQVNPIFMYTDAKRCKKACRKSEVCTALLGDAIVVLGRVLAKFSSEEALLAETEGSTIETEEQVVLFQCGHSLNAVRCRRYSE